MVVRKDYLLGSLNAFRVPVKAKYFAEIFDSNDAVQIIENPEFKNIPKFVLGDGSNTLFTGDFDGLVLRVGIAGKKIIEENNGKVLLEAGAGENWHELVSFAVKNNLGGIENLALIPGTVGAAPVQNIAAYGQNFSDVFDSLEAFDFKTGKVKRFNAEACEFGYRNSIFKKNKGRYIVFTVRLRLSKNSELETSYYQTGISHNSLKEEIQKIAAGPHTLKNVYDAVINIRKRKLPDASLVPTAGSFFLNPAVSREKFEELKKNIPDLQCYPADQLRYKNPEEVYFGEKDLVRVAAGRLIEKL
ncbi:MAG: UDP-N-acetylmuramate dehydrogenase, partial [Candidatus Wolfebacteria bacterium]|nr:UDP-N-acetylmuramate dehydrogenase [Candidatus Wolfebacteria bacterium]